MLKIFLIIIIIALLADIALQVYDIIDEHRERKLHICRTVKMKRMNDLAKMPTRGSKYAAGYDLYAATSYDIEIPAHETVKIGTGIATEIPRGYFGGIYARSGLATKRSLAPANKTGVIDQDYTGELIVALHNHSDKPQTIEAGERIAQLVIQPYLDVRFKEVDELSATERGNGGFGSTGTK